MKKTSLKTPIIVLLVFFVFVAIYFIIDKIKTNKATDSFDVQLSGIVYSKKHIDHGYGIYYLDKIKSNYKYYDTRQSHKKNYLCVVDSNKAELVYSFFTKIDLGDSISIKDKKIVVYKDGILTLSKDLVVGDISDHTLSAVEKYHQIPIRNLIIKW